MLSVLFIAAAVGLALAFMPKTENREVLLKGINGLQEVLFTLIRAILYVLPVGILAFAGQLAAQIEAGVIVGALGKYTAVVIGGNLLQFFIVLPLFLLARGLNPVERKVLHRSSGLSTMDAGKLSNSKRGELRPVAWSYHNV